MTKNTPWIEPEIFAEVETNVRDEWACTPARPDTRPRWRGILISAPTVVRARPGQPFFIPVCEIHMLPFMGIKGKDLPTMMILATNIANNKIYKGEAFKETIEGYMVPPPEIEYTAEELERIKGSAGGSAFSSDLFANANLPEESAIYDVYIELGRFKSNIVTIEVVWER